MGRGQRPNTVDDFWLNVTFGDYDWLWTGPINLSQAGVPYGRFAWGGEFPPALKGRYIGAHRFSWMLEHGVAIPRGRMICHHCDTPLCVRPDHLYLGTAKTNAQDREDRKRRDTRPGEAHHNARLTEAQVVEIRALAGTMTHGAIGERYGISRAHVGDIIRGATWQIAPGATHNSHRRGRPPQLTPEQLAAMLAERAAGATQEALAARFGLTQSGVSGYLIRHGQRSIASYRRHPPTQAPARP